MTKSLKVFFIFLVISSAIFIGAYIFISWWCMNTKPQVSLPRKKQHHPNPRINIEQIVYNDWRHLTRNEITSMSTLGRILFLNEEPPEVEDRKYQILVWSQSPGANQNYFSEDQLAHCSVQNCELVHGEAHLDTADLVIFQLYDNMTNSIVPHNHRENQIWAFFIDESPYHVFNNWKNFKLSNFNGFFNWSMTYRLDSDIPIPFGRAVRRFMPTSQQVTVGNNKRKDVLVAAYITNCHNSRERLQYLNRLRIYIDIDIYGNCGSTKDNCPDYVLANCPNMDKYLFYLAFESANCREYITEQVWWNGYEKKSIPIVMGSDRRHYAKLLPQDSYLHVEDFSDAGALARYLVYVNHSERYHTFYKWEREFEIKNEHGLFGSPSYHFCRACEALNYNSKEEKIYYDLDTFWNPTTNCYPD